MKAIVVDDEQLMVEKFLYASKDIEDIEIVGSFTSPVQAMEYITAIGADIAFIDIEMPVMNGIELAVKIREERPETIIVFVTAYEGYIHEANEIDADYYIVKPYTKKMIQSVVEKMKRLMKNSPDGLFIRTFGRFQLILNGKVLPIEGKAKEILAYIVAKCGKEVSNEEIYSKVWEGRPYGGKNLNVYYNALKRLKDFLNKESIGDILISTRRGQMVDTSLFKCDYYMWKAGEMSKGIGFEGEFLSEYPWSEPILAEMMEHYHE